MSKINNTKENSAKCICDLSRKGCICGACPLWSEYNLTDGYFCLIGEAK